MTAMTAEPAGLRGAALAPLRAGYADWLGLDAAEVLAEDPAEVWALQLLLRLERTTTPSWHRALALAATACAALCLDPRSEPGGDWYDEVSAYTAGHIRKVTRRARGTQWEATADLPGLSLADGDTEVRVLVPGRVAALDRRVRKLQVGGTDLPIDDPAPDAAEPVLRLWVPTEPPMTAGKQLAQAGHAGMIAAALLAGDDQHALGRWADAGFPATVRRASPAQYVDLLSSLGNPGRAWRDDRLLAVRDAGFTEIASGTVTVVARAPRG